VIVLAWPFDTTKMLATSPSMLQKCTYVYKSVTTGYLMKATGKFKDLNPQTEYLRGRNFLS